MILRPADAAALIKETRSQNTVLVGGQAVAVWIDYFGIAPRLAALTADIDYLGTRRDAQAADRRLHFPHRLKLGTPEDIPNTALLSVTLEGYEAPVLIDFLSGVIGVESKEIARSAVTIRIYGEELRLIHPIHLMKSKIANLYQLKAKRNAEGIEQARLSIEIVGAFLGAANLSPRQLAKAIEAIGKFAATRTAQYAKEHYNLDCLSAVPQELVEGDTLPAAFRQKRWPQIVAAAK